MNPSILQFSEIQKGDVAVAGGKGANLGELTAAGLTVPEGFVITADAYRSYLAANGLAGDGRPEEAEAFRTAIRTGTIPEALEAAILSAYRALPHGAEAQARVAVRSSATAEDLEDASFAGQQETYLNVTGEEMLLKRVRDCYASLWGDRAVAYRKSHGYDTADVALAVVVQVMVESEKAGVLFTADPVTGRKDRLRVNASYGLGESVVSGRVTADSYILDENGTVLDETVGDKATEIVYGPAGGTVERAVSEERRHARCLTDAELADLCTGAKRIATHYGMPMDIEWGIAGGTVYILQARAITTLRASTEDTAGEEEKVAAYLKKTSTGGAARTNLKFLLEKMTAPLYPLDDYAVGAINNQKANIFRTVGLEMSMQPQVDDAGITILPDNGKKLHKEIFRLPGAIRELKDFAHCRAEITARMEKHKGTLDAIKAADYATMTVQEAAEAFDHICSFVATLAYDRFYYAMFPSYFAAGGVKKVLKQADPSLTEYDLYANLDYRTALISRAVADMAVEIRKDDGTARDILAGMRYAELMEKHPALKPLFDAFLRENGYKENFNCYCVYASSYLEDPDRLVNIIRPLLSGEAAGEDADRFDGILAKIRAVTKPEKLDGILKDIADVRYFHVMREESQYYWETAYYYARCALRRISSLLYGTEDYRENIAYLFMEEFRTLKGTGRVSDGLQEKIALRRANRPLAIKVWEGCKGIVFGEMKDTLKGIGGSAGTVTGPARVITSPAEFYKMQQGDILVCQYTDPEWTPLFRLAGGVVADTGAELSHAAIVAREYGIPAVLGVGYGTASFHDDDIIRVDGTRGEVAKVN